MALPALIAMLAASIATPSADAATPALRTLTVDAGTADGVLKPLTGYTGMTNINLLRQLGITTVRTHDTGTIDIISASTNNANVIFPNFAADANDPASYRFAKSDALLKNLTSAGMVPYVRIGNAHEGIVPSDFTKYADIVRHVVMHYNQGWANGFTMGIRNWEIWNEPDMKIPGQQFWNGTPQQFYELYGAIARAIRSADPSASVGGAGETTNTPAWLDDFLQYLTVNDLPLDFFSYHHYDAAQNNPYNYFRYTEMIRQALNAAGFTDIPIVLSEWGYDLMGSATIQQLAAYESASLAYMQDAPTLAQQYLEVLSMNGGVTDRSGKLTVAGHAYLANSSLRATPTRLKVRGADTMGFTTLAGAATTISSDTPHEIRVLITNYEIPADNRGPFANGRGISGYRTPVTNDLLCSTLADMCFQEMPRVDATYTDNGGYDLTVDNLPNWAADGFAVNRYRMDATHSGSLVDSTTSTGTSLRLTATLPAPSVELVVIRAADAGSPTFAGVVRTPVGSLG